MMGRQTGNQSQLFYLFNLERRIPADHLLRRINPVVTRLWLRFASSLCPASVIRTRAIMTYSLREFFANAAIAASRVAAFPEADSASRGLNRLLIDQNHVEFGGVAAWGTLSKMRPTRCPL